MVEREYTDLRGKEFERADLSGATFNAAVRKPQGLAPDDEVDVELTVRLEV